MTYSLKSDIDLAFWDREARDRKGRWTHLAGLMAKSGGFTSINGEVPDDGYAVALPNPSGKDWVTLPHGKTNADDIKAFSETFADELAKPNRGIGGWSNSNPEFGEVRDVLDIVEVHDHVADALAAAQAAGQDAVYDLLNEEQVPTSTLEKWVTEAHSAKAKAAAAQGRKRAAARNAAGMDYMTKHPFKAGLMPGSVMKAEDRSEKGKSVNLTNIYTPSMAGDYDLSFKDGQLAFWKQVLPLKSIKYTARDGTRKSLDFTDKYLADLANSKAVDKVGFLLADKDNAHTMDPERLRGTVEEWDIREHEANPEHNGLWGKIVFPNREAAAAVLANPDLGVSARIREGIEKSDGSSIERGIIHVLGTLDPQVSGMAPWQTADLSNDGEVLDLTSETYEESQMADDKTRSVTEYTEAEIDAMTEEELNLYLAAAEAEFEGILDEDEDDDLDADDIDIDEQEKQMVSLSTQAQADIDLALSTARATRVELAQARWDKTRSDYLHAGVAPALLDLAEPIFNRPSEFVVDLSNEGTEGEINVAKIVGTLLDACKGQIDLSNESGHGGTFKTGDGEDPDKALLDAWNSQS